MHASNSLPAPESTLRQGILAAAPLWLGAAPFGIAYAVSALAAGLTPAQTLVMSLIVFAGAAQFTAVGMFAAAAAPLAVIITTLIVNVRHVLLSASLFQHLRTVPWWQRFGLATMLTDESYALGVQRFVAGDGSAAFTLGANLSIYVVWQISTLVGILIGQAIPDPTAYGLDLVFPLTFIGLLVPLLRSRTNRTIALIAAFCTIGGALWLPGSWYILLAGFAPLALIGRK